MAATAGQLWDWFEKRNIDKHIGAIAIFGITVMITNWAMGYANAHPEKSGVDIGAIIASLTAPWSFAQTFALKYWFESVSK
jgi:uncharacterized membrane protein